MKRICSILIFIVLSFSSNAQKFDSAQFKTLYDKMTAVYSKNIEPYLLKLVEAEFTPLSDNASDETKVLRQATVATKMKFNRLIVNEIFSDNYKYLSTDLDKLGNDPNSYLTGYLDMAIRSQFPHLDESFYRSNWKDLMKIQGQK